MYNVQVVVRATARCFSNLDCAVYDRVVRVYELVRREGVNDPHDEWTVESITLYDPNDKFTYPIISGVIYKTYMKEVGVTRNG